jgi:glutamine synthetase
MVLFNDPFRRKYVNRYTDSKLVWCETRTSNNIPLKNSNRSKALEIFKKYEHEEPWFGLEQEYVILVPSTYAPSYFSRKSNEYLLEPASSLGNFYCGVGFNNVPEREIAETHLKYCIYAGINICGLNAEVAPGQWEYQIGPCEGIDAGDHLWVSRYILNRVAEEKGYLITYHPKPLLNLGKEWNGSGCHTNFSTKAMREEEGSRVILDAVKKLEVNHLLHINLYGTASIDMFTFGIGSRSTSVRIPNMVIEEGKGYFEDRRPASNCDPYLVTMLITETCCEEKKEDEIKNNICDEGLPNLKDLTSLHKSHFC